jgi:hypothetical protein
MISLLDDIARVCAMDAVEHTTSMHESLDSTKQHQKRISHEEIVMIAFRSALKSKPGILESAVEVLDSFQIAEVHTPGGLSAVAPQRRMWILTEKRSERRFDTTDMFSGRPYTAAHLPTDQHVSTIFVWPLFQDSHLKQVIIYWVI